MPFQKNRPRRNAGVWEALRPLRRQLAAQRNHPIYAARGNEQPLLQQLMTDDPPVGGLAAFIADLDRKRGSP
jgi:hypothetical protein